MGCGTTTLYSYIQSTNAGRGIIKLMSPLVLARRPAVTKPIQAGIESSSVQFAEPIGEVTPHNTGKPKRPTAADGTTA